MRQSTFSSMLIRFIRTALRRSPGSAFIFLYIKPEPGSTDRHFSLSLSLSLPLSTRPPAADRPITMPRASLGLNMVIVSAAAFSFFAPHLSPRKNVPPHWHENRKQTGGAGRREFFRGLRNPPFPTFSPPSARQFLRRNRCLRGGTDALARSR